MTAHMYRPHIKYLSSVMTLMLFGCACTTKKPDDVSSHNGLSPDIDSPLVTAPIGTPLHHAQTCAQYLGPIPAVNCMDGEIMPITVDGVEVTEQPAT